MDKEETMAYTYVMLANMMIEFEAMKIDNAARSDNPPYNAHDFRELPNKYGMHHNAFITSIQTYK